MAGHVFISHSTKDDELVGELREALERLGYLTWTDSRALTAGDELEPTIRRAIVEAVHLVVVFSVQALNSPWVAREIALGLEQAATRPGFKVIPLLIPPLELGALRPLFPAERIALPFDPARDTVTDLIARLREAFGDALPADRELSPQPAAAPLAELVVDLTQLAVEQDGDERRAVGVATLRWLVPGAEALVSRPFKVHSPLGPIEAGELAWYLERFAIWPGEQFLTRAAQVEADLLRWGERLFAALDTEAARAVWEGFRRVPPGIERCISISVDPEPSEGCDAEEGLAFREAATLWLGLPWELLRDGKGFLADGANGTRVRRRLPSREEKPPLVGSTPIRVLVVSPRPEDEHASYIDHRISARPLVEAFARLGERAEVEILAEPTLAGLARALRQALARNEPFHAVHFDGHGIYDRRHGLGALCFEEPADQGKLERRRSQIVNAKTLAEKLRDHRVPLMVLEACESAMAKADPMASVAGQLLAGGVASVVAMSHSVLVETAWRFVERFYGELAAGATVGKALLEAQRRLREDPTRGKGFHGELRLRDWFVPVLYQETLDPQLVRELPDSGGTEVIAKLWAEAVEGLPEGPDHAFVGRSRELLALERLLVKERAAVLLGEGGEGKTALAVELAHWLVKAQRFDKAAFVSVEDGLAQSAHAVLSRLGGQLVRGFDATSGADFERGKQLVERALRERSTLIVLDNLESMLPDLGPGQGLSEPEALDEVLKLMLALTRVGETRVVFTSRSPLPSPFADARYVLRIGRLERREAIELVGKVLEAQGSRPAGSETEDDVQDLVDAAGCHARSLVLLAREVATSGVRFAAERMGALMASMAARYPDDRERSLFASVELSLRRLPPETRAKAGPLAVFHGGGHGWVIAQVLGLDYENDEEARLGKQLVDVGLAEAMPYGHLRLHPALGPALRRELGEEEHERARAAWVQAMVQLTGYLYGQKVKDPQRQAVLTLLELPNLLAALDTLRASAPAEQVVALATKLEGLLQHLGRAKALAHVVQVREEAAKRLGDWSHAAFEAESAAIDRLLEAGRFAAAVDRAQKLLLRAEAAGEAAYPEAAYDFAMASARLGRALKKSGSAGEALPALGDARNRFSQLAAGGNTSASRMASACLTESGDCLMNLGRLDEAAAAYEQAIELDEARHDQRDVATGKGQLGTVRMLQGRHAEALAAWDEARQIFETLGEPGSVAVAWHQIGRVHQEAGQLQAAEQAYQRSLAMKVQLGNKPGQASTLNQLGNLASRMGRREEAVRFYRDAATIYREVGDGRNEGFACNNMANQLVKLQRWDEARKEVLRAIECAKPFGHSAEAWKTFNVLHNLERALGHTDAAARARQQAIDAFLAYRQDGGENHSWGGQLVAGVAQAIAAGEEESKAAGLEQIARKPDLPSYARVLIPALQQILTGSRDPALAANPVLDFDDAVELHLLLHHLTPNQPT